MRFRAFGGIRGEYQLQLQSCEAMQSCLMCVAGVNSQTVMIQYSVASQFDAPLNLREHRKRK